MIVRLKPNAYRIIGDALEKAIESGCDKSDKYHETQLESTQRQLLLNHITNYLWLNIVEAGIEFE